MATSLIVNKTTTAMKSNQKSIPNISDTASDYDCANFATHLIEDLSTDTVDGVYRINKTDITNAEPTTPKTQATITLSKTTATISEITSAGTTGIISYITYNGDGNIYAINPDILHFQCTVLITASTPTLKIAQNDTPNAGVTITVRADETATYTAAEATLTITA